MTNPAVTINRLEALQIALNFTAQIAFDRELIVRNRVNDFVELLWRQIFRAQIRIDTGLLKDPLRSAQTDSVNVSQRRFDAFVRWNFYSK